MAKYEMPVIDVPKEDVKVNVSMAQDADNVSLMLVIPFDILREADQSKIGMILRHTYNELSKSELPELSRRPPKRPGRRHAH